MLSTRSAQDSTMMLRVRRLAIASIVVAFAVMAMKFIAWWLTGSVALYSDALESIVNVIAATTAFVAIAYAQRPADTDHPYGHYKAEYMSAVLEGVLIVVAALLILREAMLTLWSGSMAIDAPGAGLAVNLVATLINLVFAQLLLRNGRAARSPALLADGKHIMADVITSLGVLIGLVLALASGWLWLDPVLALVVAINIVREGAKVILESLNGLMDRAVDEEEERRIRNAIVTGGGGALEVHDIRTRIAGPLTFIEFHLVVDGTMSVEQSHRICDRIEDELRAELPGARIVIHVEPDHKAKQESIKL